MRKAILLGFLMALGSGVMVSAPRAANANEGAVRAKVRERLRAVRAAKIIDLLHLDQAGSARLFPILNRYDDQLLVLRQNRRTAVREIRQLVAAGSKDSARLNVLIDTIVASEKQEQELRNVRARDVRTVLTPEQTAKLIVTLPEIDRDLHRAVREARRGAWDPASK